MGELAGLLPAGVLGPGRPACHGPAEGPKALAEPEARATAGRLALPP
jgi:NADPH2:quinone reductase